MISRFKITKNAVRSNRLSAMLRALCSLRFSLRHALCALHRAVNRAPQAESLVSPATTRISATGKRLPASRIQYPVSGIQYPASSIRHPAAGFTLMEILLAFLILAIVMSAILGSFDAVFSTTDTLENSSKYYDMAKNCLQRMSLDLDSLYVTQPPFYKKPEFDDPPDSYRLVGTSADAGGTGFAGLRFTSKAHIPLDNSSRGGIAEIVYYVQAKTDDQLVLRRADHLFPYPPFEEKGGDPVLCQHVKSLAFKYFGAEGEESEGWNSDTADYNHATPTAIGIALEIGNESVSYAFETTVRLAVQRQKIE